MKVKNIGSNMTEVETKKGSILISYSTPVACRAVNGGCFKTSTKHSQTTTRHINKWLQGLPADEKPQSFFDDLI